MRAGTHHGFRRSTRIVVPSEADYLAFAGGTSSSRRLRSLKAALDALLPGNPAVHVVLAGAIDRKSPLGLEPLLLSALRHLGTGLRRDLGTVAPLKFGRLDNLPGLAATRGLAADLLAECWKA